ncbi:MAG: PEP-CTERM sorting domain-containing protein, partial [Planctomycetales bacterium]|nr:PEP-CTERM sorting domain-containing protein [Planctomycetales bacterium]
ALVFSVSTASADLNSVIQAGADRVDGLQHTDGKWGWPLNAPPTYNNITGPIGLGQINAYTATGDPNHLTSATDAGNALDGLTADWVGSYNPMFLLALYDATGTASYLTQAQSFYTDLNAGTYTRSAVNYDTAGFISLVQTNRAGVWMNLLPWEFAPLTYAASQAGNATQEAAFMQAMKDAIDTLDNSDPNTVYSDIIGLAGGVMGLSLMGEDFDPTAGAYSAASSTADLADTLANLQNPNGSWYWHSNLSSPTAGDEDLQTTAYAVLALLAANDSAQFDDEIYAARGYLMAAQLGNGGWNSYPGGSENAEVDGEIVWALAASAAVVPEPGSITLVGIGLISLIASRRQQVR